MMRVGVALLAGSAVAVCPPPAFDSVSDFDLGSFISKRWYIQQLQETPDLPIDENYCVHVEYKKETDFEIWGYEVNVNNYAEEKDGTVHDSGSLLKAKVVNEKKGQLAVAPWFLPTFFAGPYWVIAYDENEGYALISGGPPMEEGIDGKCVNAKGVKGSGLWIFTRAQKRDASLQELVNKVRHIADNKGFDVTVFNDVDHSNCDRKAVEEVASEDAQIV